MRHLIMAWLNWLRTRAVPSCLIAVFYLAVMNVSATAQVPVEAQQAMQFGEFPRALEVAEQLPTAQREAVYADLARAQLRAGASGAWDTASRIGDDRSRTAALNSLHGFSRGGFQDSSPNPPAGNSGGITIRDFQPLISLIQQTIQPDSWSTSQGEGTIVPYVTGVYVDASGAVRRIDRDASQRLNSVWDKLADRSQEPTTDPSPLRKISLIDLERAVQTYALQGRTIPDELQNLAGIFEIRYLMIDQENHDLLIAGPAGPWHHDPEGVVVNDATGRPVLQLDDLVTCLRSTLCGAGRFGCAITPRQENLAAAKTLLATKKLKGKQLQTELRDAVGLQDVEVFGISHDCSTAQILVEADYRMKLVGMGLEPGVMEIPSYFQRAFQDPQAPPPMDVARWWFTLDFEGINVNPQNTVYELVGTGVKVLSETELLGPDGQRVHTNQAVGPTKAFAEDFTQHFDKIAAKYPIYYRLRNVFALAMIGGLIKREGLAQRVGWNLTYFGLERDDSRLVYHPRTTYVAKTVESVMNFETRTTRKASSTIRQDLIGISGGIDCPVQKTIDEVKYGRMAEVPEWTRLEENSERDWWWD